MERPQSQRYLDVNEPLVFRVIENIGSGSGTRLDKIYDYHFLGCDFIEILRVENDSENECTVTGKVTIATRQNHAIERQQDTSAKAGLEGKILKLKFSAGTETLFKEFSDQETTQTHERTRTHPVGACQNLFAYQAVYRFEVRCWFTLASEGYIYAVTEPGATHKRAEIRKMLDVWADYIVYEKNRLKGADGEVEAEARVDDWENITPMGYEELSDEYRDAMLREGYLLIRRSGIIPPFVKGV